jgi:hypothetical protein
LNLWSGKSIEERGIGNGDFPLIGHFSPKIEGLVTYIEKVMKTKPLGTSLYHPIREKPFRKQNPIPKPSDYPVKKFKTSIVEIRLLQ